MEFEREMVATASAVGILMAFFFASGFVTSEILDQSNDEVKPETTPEPEVSQDEAISGAKSYLESGPFSYPFAYNLSTSSVEEVEFGGGSFYNWTLSYTVEANPLNSPIYSVPGNQTKAEKDLNLYVSRDGRYLFQSGPIEIK